MKILIAYTEHCTLKTSEYALVSSTCKIVTNISYTGHKVHLNKFQMIEIIQNTCPDYCVFKPEVNNNNKKKLKDPHMFGN